MYTAALQHSCLLYEFQAPLINCKLHEAARDFIFVGFFDHLTCTFCLFTAVFPSVHHSVRLEVST